MVRNGWLSAKKALDQCSTTEVISDRGGSAAPGRGAGLHALPQRRGGPGVTALYGLCLWTGHQQIEACPRPGGILQQSLAAKRLQSVQSHRQKASYVRPPFQRNSLTEWAGNFFTVGAAASWTSVK